MRATELEALRRDLGSIVGMRHVTQADAHREPYARDLWPRAQLWARAGESRFPPDAVVWPRTPDEVSRIVRYARERHIPITPFGAGSSVVGGALATRAGITMDLKRMRDVLALDLGARRVTAQAGIMGQRFEDTLQNAGATLGHFPSSIHCSTLGGWIAARGAGQFSSHYGKIEDMLLGLTAVAGTGDIVKAGPERAPGIDLVQLLCGSEGTLAIVTDATLSIHPRPTARAMRGFHTKNTAAGLDAMRRLFRAGLRPQLLRLYDPLDSLVAGSGSESADHDDEVPGPLAALVHGLKQRSVGVALSAPAMLNRAAHMLPERALLVLSFEGEQLASCEEQLRAAMDVMRETGAADLGEGPAKRWYARRHSTGYKQSGVFTGHGWVDTMEVAATWDRILPVFNGVREAAKGEAFVLCHFSHAYLEGCSLYFTMIGPAPTVERGEASYERTWKAALRAAFDAGATLSHHHGVGISKARLLPDELGDSGMRLLRSLKATFDPDGILNPGKLLG